MVTLRQLRYLAALGEHRHFGWAADACAVTQPALSTQIRDLEAELGVDLVERRPGEAALTEVGIEIARRAGQVLAATRDLVDFAHHSRRLLRGLLQLGIIPTLAPYLLPRLLPLLQGSYPELRVQVRETKTETLLGELTRGALDVLLLALPIIDPEIETIHLFRDAFLLALPVSDPIPETTRATPCDISNRKLLLLEEGHCLRNQALDYCSHQRHQSAALGATSLTTVLQMVAHGYGVTLLPAVAVDVELRDERVKLVRFAEPQPGRNIGLAWRRTSPRKHDFDALGRAVIESLGLY
jgi:LysR family hydrogen peroxide-inducible transcriptional activator